SSEELEARKLSTGCTARMSPSSIALAARLRERLQRGGVEHDDGTVFETYPISRSPHSQLLVDAFASHANHLTELLLSDRDRAAGGREIVFFGQAEQRSGEPARQVLKNDLLDLIAGPAQPCAEQFDDLHRQIGMSGDEGEKIAPVDREELAIAVRGGVRGTRVTVQHRDFAEQFTGADQVQDRAAAIGGGYADLHRSRDHRKQAVAGIALGDNGGAALQGEMLGVTAELLERLRR